MMHISEPMVRRLSERGDITTQDAMTILSRCYLKDVMAALNSGTVHELRDRTLINLRDMLIRRYPVA